MLECGPYWFQAPVTEAVATLIQCLRRPLIWEAHWFSSNFRKTCSQALLLSSWQFTAIILYFWVGGGGGWVVHLVPSFTFGSDDCSNEGAVELIGGGCLSCTVVCELSWYNKLRESPSQMLPYSAVEHPIFSTSGDLLFLFPPHATVCL